jgi:hypothetical protein
VIQSHSESMELLIIPGRKSGSPGASSRSDDVMGVYSNPTKNRKVMHHYVSIVYFFYLFWEFLYSLYIHIYMYTYIYIYTTIWGIDLNAHPPRYSDALWDLQTFQGLPRRCWRATTRSPVVVQNDEKEQGISTVPCWNGFICIYTVHSWGYNRKIS